MFEMLAAITPVVPEEVGLDHTQSVINSIGIGLLGAAMTFATTWFWFARNAAVTKTAAIALEHATLLARVAELETQRRVDAQTMTPIVSAFQGLLIKQLTHADKPEMDDLMVKLGPPDILTDEEHDRLHVMLEARSHDMEPNITSSERDAATILPYVMKMAAEEQANMKNADAAQDLKLVTIVSVVGANTAPPKDQPEQPAEIR